MDTPYDILISNERAKIVVLEAKIAECRRRISTFESMKASDDLDDLLDRRVGAVAVVSDGQPVTQANEVASETASNEINSSDFPKKALNKNSLSLLRFAGRDDKSIDQFLAHASEQGISESRQRIRAFLHQYKTTYGLLTSDRDGHFRLSDKGVVYLASLKDESSPTEGASSAT